VTRRADQTRRNIHDSCRRSCRNTHTLPYDISCLEDSQLCSDFDGKLAGRMRTPRPCGFTSFRVGRIPEGMTDRTCPAFSDHPLPTTGEDDRKTLHARVHNGTNRPGKKS